jgi:hypothetical protein
MYMTTTITTKTNTIAAGAAITVYTTNGGIATGVLVAEFNRNWITYGAHDIIVQREHYISTIPCDRVDRVVAH